jgi:hypothetical protein
VQSLALVHTENKTNKLVDLRKNVGGAKNLTKMIMCMQCLAKSHLHNAENQKVLGAGSDSKASKPGEMRNRLIKLFQLVPGASGTGL